MMTHTLLLQVMDLPVVIKDALHLATCALRF